MGGLFGGRNTKVSDTSPIIASFRVQTSAYGRPIPMVFGKARVAANLLWYGDFVAIPHTAAADTGGASGGKGGGGTPDTSNTTYTYQTAVLMLLSRGAAGAITRVWRDKEISSLAALGLSFYSGDGSQLPFPHLSTNHPGEALAYRRRTYVASAALDLGDSAQLKTFSFELEGESPFSVSIKDANPKDVVLALAAAAGVADRIGDLDQFSDYCVANGIFIAPAYVEQRAAAELLAEIARIGNAEVVPSEDKIKLVPYSDQAKTGNGVTFTPQATPVFEFTDEDFLITEDEEPVTFEEDDTSDAYNVVKVKFYNRAKDYAEDVVEAQDDDNIALYGRRPMEEPISLFPIVDAGVAMLVATNELARQLYFRTSYRFKVGPGKADLLEPMDVIAITRASLDISALPVRIREIEELEDGKAAGFSFLVREFPAGPGAGVLYPVEEGVGYGVDYNVDAGDTNAPVVMDAPAVATDSGFELWLAASGADPNWGGCQVWVATDPGGPFRNVGAIHGAARHGELSASFASGLDPDTVNTCAVDLTESRGSLTGGAQDDADNLTTSAWIEGELISFQDATLTAPNEYDLETYLRRGIYNTPIVAHDAGERFVRLDQAVFRYPYEPGLVGKTLYVKLPAFNIFGGALQDLSEISATAYVIGGPIGAPDAPAGFTVQQAGNLLNFKVDPVATLRLDRVEVRYADPGETDWNNGIPVTNILRGNTDSNGSVPPGFWRFMARSYDLAGNPSATWAVYDATVSAGNYQAIVSRQSAPGWLGTITNFVVTWSGALIPKGQNPAGSFAGNEWIDEWVPDPYPTCTYEEPEIDKAVDAPARIWGDIVSVLGPGVATGTANPQHQVDYRLEADAYDGFDNWTIGVANFRRLKSRLVLDTTVGLAKITAFATTIDAEPVTEEKHNLTIGPTGLAVVFDNKFHIAPSIVALSDDATPKFATHTADSATGTTLHLYNTSATEVGGSGGYRARGP